MSTLMDLPPWLESLSRRVQGWPAEQCGLGEAGTGVGERSLPESSKQTSDEGCSPKQLKSTKSVKSGLH